MVRLNDLGCMKTNDSRVGCGGLSRQPKTSESDTLRWTGQPTYLGVRDGHDRVVVYAQVLGATGTKTPGDGLTTERLNNLVSHLVSYPALTCHSFMCLISPFVIP